MASETSTDTMMRDQEIAMIVIRTMKALKRQEEKKIGLEGNPTR
jgi:hypothetical protein